jgi:hypothetical protein
LFSGILYSSSNSSFFFEKAYAASKQKIDKNKKPGGGVSEGEHSKHKSKDKADKLALMIQSFIPQHQA